MVLHADSLLRVADKAFQLADHVHRKRQERIAARAAQVVRDFGINEKRGLVGVPGLKSRLFS